MGKANNEKELQRKAQVGVLLAQEMRASGMPLNRAIAGLRAEMADHGDPPYELLVALSVLIAEKRFGKGGK